MKTTADVLADAREYMEEHGWLRGELQDPFSGRVCAVGAIRWSQGWMRFNLAPEDDKLLHDTMDRLHDVIDCEWLADWNDYSAVDQQQVLDMFAKAEKIERNGGVDPDA